MEMKNEKIRILGIAGYFGLDEKALMNGTRMQYVCDVRYVIWRILREEGWKYQDIARMFGKHHSTIIHGVRQAKEVREVVELYERVSYLLKKL